MQMRPGHPGQPSTSSRISCNFFSLLWAGVNHIYLLNHISIKQNCVRLFTEMVEMKILFISLLALCLAASAQAVSGADKIQNVGGDFGRAWLESYLAQNPRAPAEGGEDNLSSWGGAPEGNASVGSNLFNQQETTPPVQDWLGITTPLGIQNNTKSRSPGGAIPEIPFFISKTITPIHQIDASWNQTLRDLQFPEPDKSGLIYGVPAEIYYSIGPAYIYF
jgi:hypothetical protein